MQKINLFEKYDSLLIQEKEFLEAIWKEKELSIGGVVNYKSMISNGIKFFTQSIFSHTNFFDIKTKVAIGAEDLQSVLLRDYKNGNYGSFYYIAKYIDFDYLSFIFSFDYIEDIMIKLGKFGKNDVGRLKKKFVKYCVFMDKNPESNLETILINSFDDIELTSTDINKVDTFLIKKSKIKSFCFDDLSDFDELKKYLNYLKDFLLLGIIKHILINLHKEYDLKGTLSTSISPWQIIDLSQESYFCSEFVGESLLYAGIYPFDLGTKDPKSISPGDILDSSIIYKDINTRYYYINQDNDLGNKIIEISSEEFIFFKNYIINKESSKLYFNRQKVFVETFDNIIKLVSLKIMKNHKVNTNLQNNNFLRGTILGIFISFIMAFIVVGSTSNYQADISSNLVEFNMNFGIGLWSIFKFSIFFVVQLLLVFVLLYFFIFYVIPFIKLIISIFNIFGLQKNNKINNN